MKTCIAESFSQQYRVDPRTACFVWLRSLERDGYGQFWYKNKKYKAHRWAYEQVHGSIPSGLFVLHKCDNPACVNPKHLFLGTNSDNMLDTVRKGRKVAPVFHGEEHGMAILTEAKVRRIRQRIARGDRQCDVARDFGISAPLVYRIKKRIIWKHI